MARQIRTRRDREQINVVGISVIFIWPPFLIKQNLVTTTKW